MKFVLETILYMFVAIIVVAIVAAAMDTLKGDQTNANVHIERMAELQAREAEARAAEAWNSALDEFFESIPTMLQDMLFAGFATIAFGTVSGLLFMMMRREFK